MKVKDGMYEEQSQAPLFDDNGLTPQDKFYKRQAIALKGASKNFSKKEKSLSDKLGIHPYYSQTIKEVIETDIEFMINVTSELMHKRIKLNKEAQEYFELQKSLI